AERRLPLRGRRSAAGRRAARGLGRVDAPVPADLRGAGRAVVRGPVRGTRPVRGGRAEGASAKVTAAPSTAVTFRDRRGRAGGGAARPRHPAWRCARPEGDG